MPLLTIRQDIKLTKAQISKINLVDLLIHGYVI